MKVLLLIGLSLLVDTRWVRGNNPQQSFHDQELGEESRQLQAHLIKRLLRNRQEHVGKTEFNAADNGNDSLKKQSSPVKAEGLIILGNARSDGNDSPLERNTDGESVDKDSQYEEHDIRNFLRSIGERPVNQEINYADTLRKRRLENYANDTIALTVSPPTPEEWIALQKRNSLKRTVNNKITLDQRRTLFKYIFVLSNGVISLTPPSDRAIEVAATHDVSDNAHKIAATTVARMTQHMSPSLFQTLTTQCKVGLFTKAETLTVYPEYSELATPPGCESSCSGYCANSCTFDGRKYSSLAGAGGSRAVVLDDNVLCNSNDAYNKRSNILVHEFAHTIHGYGLSSTLTNRISAAYAQAKASSTWLTDAYSMANKFEYFGAASQSFFSAEQSYYATGGMNRCTIIICQTESEGRQHLKKKDPDLYAILSEVYTDNRPSLLGNIGVCTKA
ncbi:hypothetical protein ACJMK2_003781 [Sinanodonta woodiana]|uniref:Lysine-specific metallo-endopeptidase domain-containing protein n=1 Tax=Sinanodonta woodiana TaxID=1069815 RepID=A0ABD3Y2A2_SINWO